MENLTLNPEQKQFLAAVVNRYGRGDGPTAHDDGANIVYFTLPYVRECVKKARRRGGFSAEGQALLEGLPEALR